MQKLRFSVDEFEPIENQVDEDYEQAKQERFTKVKIRLFGDGENAHTEPVDFEVLKQSADSAYDIPLIAELNPYRSNEDFGGHGVLTGKEFSFGFVKESKDNPIVFEKDENGKTFITLYGLIWKKYFENVVNIIRNNENKVEVSVELDIIKGKMAKSGKPIMNRFVLNAITFLGKITTAACKGANATLCFSEEENKNFILDKEKYLMEHFSQFIKIDNTKESAIDSSSWRNPRQKLLNPILKASNKISLLNEAYLFYNDDGDITLSDVKYPHHVIENNTLVLHKKGVQAAFARLAQQNKVEGKAKTHLLRHYRELGLNEENFEEFGLTKENYSLYFEEEIGKEDTDLENTKEIVFEECEKVKEGETVEESEVIEETSDGKESEAFLEENEKFESTDEEEKEESKTENEKDNDKSEEEMSSDDGVPPQEPLKTPDEVTVEELYNRLEKLETENAAYLEKINAMSDYEDLKAYKEEMENKAAQEKEMASMVKVFEQMEAKGVNITEETKKELLDNRENFSNIDAWSNYVKAYAFDNCEKTEDGIIKFEMPISHNSNQNEEYGIWASLKNKFNK